MALQVAQTPSERTNGDKGKNAQEKVDKTLTEEIVIGICSSIGSLRDNLIEAIVKRLKDYEYEYEVIKLSSFIEKSDKIKYKPIEKCTEAYSQLKYKIEGGNRLRQTH